MVTPLVVLITGASSGIGRATAIALLELGHIVYASARRLDRMEDLQQRGAQVISLDITDDSSIKNAVSTIIAQQKRIDVLVNNAGYGSMGALEDVSIDEARRQFEVNLFGLGRITQLILPSMREQNFGRIVNIGSMGGKMTTPLGGWYHATKFALEAYSDILRFETKAFGIDVVLIEPGAIASEWETIANASMVAVSGKGAYAKLVAQTSKMFARTYRYASSANHVAKTVVKAATIKHPKSRYSVGFMAKPFIFIRAILPDWLYDTVLRLVIK